ncbi:glycoside hydrolase family 16 protein [Streptomyces pinistramenti]|uniref:glycoside hydrolase family 16 protein n=1 Tax=Streptomyces pinistramenti TaxID=2884812 RepID=UPI001D064924|nr:glycoside hydrolase family 16 protein [Streptomyces pinistramenti]MCB5909906.1 family 16 glycosylhydrolase [Streptomyces pinistramenti]
MSMSSRTRAALFAACSVLAAVAALAVPLANAREPAPAPRATATQEAPPAAFQEVWHTDFDGAAGSRPSADDWITDTGTGYPGGPPNWGTGERQTYTDSPDNLQLDGDGHLKITARKDGGTWTSGRIETRRADFAAPEGGKLRIEASIRLPEISGDQALGYWPAFWTLGADFRGNYQNWPGIGEFDIMENVNGANQVWATLHCGVSPGGPCNETQGKGSSRECPGAACQAGFHTYALELDRTDSAAESLNWYVDGQRFHTVTSAEMDADTWAKATHHGHFLLLNLAMGGGFPDGVAGRATPTDTTAPGGSLLVDRVAVSVAQPAAARTTAPAPRTASQGATS